MAASAQGMEHARLERLRAALLGAPCTVCRKAHHPVSPVAPSSSVAAVSGTLLEVRRLWLPPPPSPTTASVPRDARGNGGSRDHINSCVNNSSSSSGERAASPMMSVAQDGPLYGFVRVKDVDHRISGWFPLHSIHVKFPRALTPSRWHAAAAAVHIRMSSLRSPSSSLLKEEGAEGQPKPSSSRAASFGADWHEAVFAEARRAAEEEEGEGDGEGPASAVVTAPLLSAVYAEVTPGMARTQRAKKPLDYLEERLLRDGKTPTTIRLFVYAGRYVFPPWYFAPYGLLHREYDPLLAAAAPASCGPASSSIPSSATGGKREGAAVKADDALRHAGQGSQPNPFIKDAYLCPFSLRIYSTFEQLRYETVQYRSQRLRPPGYEIYRDDRRGISCFEVNGSHNVTYCRHLFLLGKSFLENKLAGHDVHSYFFYVVCLHERHVPGYLDVLASPSGQPAASTSTTSTSDTAAMFFAGYFTWEKQVAECNLACIVTLPCFTANHSSGSSSGWSTEPTVPQPPRGIGQLMIAISYELAYRRRQVGSPERPLSDLGAAAYQRFWRRALVRWLHDTAPQLLHAASAPARGVAAARLALRNGASAGALTSAAAPVGRKRGRPPGRGRPGRPRASQRGQAAQEGNEVIVVDSEEEMQYTALATTPTAAAATAQDRSGVVDVSDSSVSSSATSSLSPDASDEEGGKRARGRVAGRRRATKAAAATTNGRGGRRAAVAAPDTDDHRGVGDDNEEEEDGVPPIVCLQQIATEVGLEEQDVLQTMLGMGLLHRSAEDRSMRLVIPEAFLAWAYHRQEMQESSLAYCAFDPALLFEARHGTHRSGGSGRRKAE